MRGSRALHRITVINPFGGAAHRQSIWENIARNSGIEVIMFVPIIWRNEYGRKVEANLRSDVLTLKAIPTMLAGKIPLHFFRQTSEIKEYASQSDLTYIYNEAHFASTIQIANVISKDIIFGFHSNQNIERSYPFPFSNGEKFVFGRANFATSLSENVSKVLQSKSFSGAIGRHRFGLEDFWFEDITAMKGTPSFVFVGRFVEEKGIDTILDAFKHIRTKCRLTFVGAGPILRLINNSRADLRSHIIETLLANTQHEMIKCLDEADCIIVPSKTTKSWKEQFGRVVIEGGARGVYPLVSSSGELPYLVQEIGFGQVFEENNPEELRKLTESVISNLELIRSKRIARGNTIKQLFNENSIATELANFLQLIINNSIRS